ncbi:S1 family peptidase [Methanolobus chelungpuianus]|uniref:S1 family peptidase n=1 Tax=Methanolobus chelungpuianus TaxID=502115 RepID=UPI0021158B09|nr:S1 family peptidase [Methanolobus chelungpuianus]
MYKNTSTNLWYSATSSFAAQDSSGNKGFVMSGHCARTSGGVGGDIYQPDNTRKVGDVTYYNCVFSDAAWVKTNSVTDDIYWANNNIVKDVVSYGDPSLGDTVYLSGIVSGTTTGTVTAEYVRKISTVFGPLQDQFVASYNSNNGDSGGPVFMNYGSNTVKIVGVHWGHDSPTQAVFSPVSGVTLDLNVVLRIYN